MSSESEAAEAVLCEWDGQTPEPVSRELRRVLSALATERKARETAESQRNELADALASCRAERDALKAERDEWKKRAAALDGASSIHAHCRAEIEKWERRANESRVQTLNRIGDEIATLKAERDELLGARELNRIAITNLTGEVEQLAKFKSYVHQRLDAAGVETHPEGPHSKEGCRVGDRLDLLIETRDAAVEARGHTERTVAAVNGRLRAEKATLRADLKRKEEALAKLTSVIHHAVQSNTVKHQAIHAEMVHAIYPAADTNPLPLQDPPTHAHRCMRCEQEFACQTPGSCTALYRVLPIIIGADGVVRDHGLSAGHREEHHAFTARQDIRWPNPTTPEPQEGKP